MCGILGIVDLPGRSPRLSRADVDAMRDTMADRGPDGAGTFAERNVILAHRRLAIRDREGGTQPWVTERPPLALVYNGEIYNDTELKRLLSTGVSGEFQTRCDTEVIPAAYLRWGERCVEHFAGMFAFGLYDLRQDRLLLARDRFGVKPLYFSVIGSQFVFASSIASILRHPELTPEPNYRAVSHYLSTLRLTLARETMYRGIFSLLPGERLIWDRGQIRIERYWNYPSAGMASEKPDDVWEAAETLQQDLRRSVSRRLRADVPVGLFLSGGVDSSTLSVAVRDQTNRDLPAVCGFGTGAEEDLSAAKRCADHVKADLTPVRVDADRYRGRWEAMVERFRLPMATPNDVVIAEISAAIKPTAGVVLGGEGADELLAGYDAVSRGADDFDRLRAIETGQSGLTPSAERLFRSSLLRYSGRTQFESAVDYYFATNSLLLPEAKRALLRPQVWEAIDADDAVRQWYAGFFEAGQQTADGYARLLHEVNLESLLSRLDRATMSVGLEARVPYTDHELVATAFRMPHELKIAVAPEEPAPFLAAGELKRRGTLEGKRPLRTLARSVLPHALADRPKTSFPTPVGRWLSQEWSASTAERLRSSEFLRTMLTDEAVDGLADATPHLGMQAWPLVNLAMWGDSEFENRAAA
ncbi:asparagine synthase (glutamine-hydrolyzing) [Stratiformator vulcanicus]|uniref:asparagine synthase (glutamine-hydrolyzing) n=1 Tax=Stratiformator vulcanicus TaxID=2527980 RepID=A0A517R4V8_9PLAN|nr:asparagine synthase (glutamine-hydrolyzing) [Stratiformator vulcanicus]QDT38853.1 Asparagine synthetase [glutamine-hydrolyzing] 3 [Stratiformator vulcanicus]